MRSSSVAAAAAAATTSSGSKRASPLIELMEDRGARLTTAAQMAWAEVLRPGDTAVDATAGNGHDTLALARLVGPSGRVWALDVQDAALAATRARLEAELPGFAAESGSDARSTGDSSGTDSSSGSGSSGAPEVRLVRACHSRLQEVVGSVQARVVAFNLGYLPSGDKAVTTAPDTTVAALEAALEVLRPGGLMTVMAYTNHAGGREEYEAVSALLAELSPAYWVTSEVRIVNRPTAPVLLLCWRRSDAVAAGGGEAGEQRRR